MTKKDKLFIKFFKNPQSVKYRELVTILTFCGFEHIPAKGSHQKFKHKKINQDLIIPLHNNDCKNFYKNIAAKIITKHHLL